MNYTELPPIGVMPLATWRSRVHADRRRDLLSAMRRYAVAGKPAPIEWLDELESMLAGGAA